MSISPLPLKWKISAEGGYHALIMHPFVDKDFNRLTEVISVVCLSAGFFGPKIGVEVSGIDNESPEHIENRGRESLKKSETAFWWKFRVSCSG